MEMTVYNTNILRKLDTKVYSGAPATIETQFGDVTVRKALTPGYVAELEDGSDVPETYAHGATPAIAFLALGEALKRDEAAAKAAKVLAFPQAA